MPEKAVEKGWFGHASKGVAFTTSVIGLIAAGAGLWLKWPDIRESIWPEYRVSYEYVVIPKEGLQCVSSPYSTIKVGDVSEGILQNVCQNAIIAGTPRNDVNTAWYLRVTNEGRAIDKLSTTTAGGAQSSTRLGEKRSALICLGFEGTQGRGSMDWQVGRIEASDQDGANVKSFSIRPPPLKTELRTAGSDCPALFVGYPPT
ncbi:hypothetical protein ELH21_09205 [Rhizobium leguminosarum]|uniref:hypothetical protein n=1 Tax=Rhizobium leguminosarum TaxID=384 RepID=UPI001030058E|nr:hypothetical protein [Rhizobium leguminosarum]TBD04555.1 hypothetical protein ELH21_09205 [Rhizobium leguminosarum]